MKISSHTLDFSSQHSAASVHTVKESLRAWIGPQRPDFEGNRQNRPARSDVAGANAPVKSEPASPPPTISTAAYAAQLMDDQSSSAQAIHDAIDNANHDPILGLIRMMVEMLTGHAVHVFAGFDPAPSAPTVEAPPSAAATQGQGGNPPLRPAGFGIEYDRHEVRMETEQTTFQASGTVRTSDGKEISLQLSLSMQRSYVEESNISLRAGDGVRKDPLVLNFGGTAAQLQDRRFSFDLLGDGKQMNVPLLGGGSGYLAFDRNGNGKIDSGKELFGTASGDGFADLAKLDSDGNGWIDENDPAFDKLKVWTPDASGSGSLATLQERNVGALFLGKQATPFELRNAANQSLGAVRSSGIYLTENGNVGSLQQVDLTV